MVVSNGYKPLLKQTSILSIHGLSSFTREANLEFPLFIIDPSAIYAPIRRTIILSQLQGVNFRTPCNAPYIKEI